MADTRLVVRLDQGLMEAIDKAAAGGGVTRSEWARAVLSAGVEWDWIHRIRPTRVEMRGVGSRRPLGVRLIMDGECLHPPSAFEDLPGRVICGLCGVVVRRTDGVR